MTQEIIYDLVGQHIQAGDIITYSGRTGSHSWTNVGRVEEIISPPDKATSLRVTRLEKTWIPSGDGKNYLVGLGKEVRLTNLKSIVKAVYPSWEYQQWAR